MYSFPQIGRRNYEIETLSCQTIGVYCSAHRLIILQSEQDYQRLLCQVWFSWDAYDYLAYRLKVGPFLSNEWVTIVHGPFPERTTISLEEADRDCFLYAL